MPRSPLIVCLLGYDSNTCYLSDKACSNYRSCQVVASAWPLPFYFDDENGALVVSFSRASSRERWNQTVINDTLLGGFASDYYDADFAYDIQLIWKQFGWMPAELNPNFPFYLDPDYDPIPF